MSVYLSIRVEVVGPAGPTTSSRDRIDRADIVDEAVLEIDALRQGLVLGVELLDALVGGIAAGEDPAVDQQGLAGLPGGDIGLGQPFQVDAADIAAGLQGDLRPGLDVGRGEDRRSLAVEMEMDMAGGGAVGDHRHRQRGGVGRVFADLDVDDGGQAAEALGADAEVVDRVVDLQAQFLELVGRTALDQFLHVDRFHQRFLGQQHGLVDRAADADAEDAGRAPAGAHGRHGLLHPLDDRVARVEHHRLALVLRAAPLGGDQDLQAVACHQFGVDHRRAVVAGVLAVGGRVGDHRQAQGIGGIQIGAPHPGIDHLLHRHVAVEAAVHADLDKGRDDAGVLTDRAMADGGHPRVDEDLADGILGRLVLFPLVGGMHGLDEIEGMVVGDKLQAVGDGVDEIGFFDDLHGLPFLCLR